MKWYKCKYTITILVIISFLCQNMAWAYGPKSEEPAKYKLAKDTELDNEKFLAVSKALGGLLQRWEKTKTFFEEDIQNLSNLFIEEFTKGKSPEEAAHYRQNLKIIYHPRSKSFYLYSKNPRNGPGVVYRIRLKKYANRFVGGEKPFDTETIGNFEVALLNGPFGPGHFQKPKPVTALARELVLKLLKLVTACLLVIIVASQVITTKISFAQAQPASGSVSVQAQVDYLDLFNALDRLIELQREQISPVEQVENFGAETGYNSLTGASISGNYSDEWGGVNPVLVFGDDGFSGLATAYRDFGGYRLSLRGGGLDYNPDNTFFGLLGVNRRFGPVSLYLGTGWIERTLDGSLGHADGPLLDFSAGAELLGHWQILAAASGPVFIRPTVETTGDYGADLRRYEDIVGNLPRLSLDVRYRDRFGRIPWVLGVSGARGGLGAENGESRIDNTYTLFGPNAGVGVNLGSLYGSVEGQYSFIVGQARGQYPGISAGLDWNSFSLRSGVVTGQGGLFWTFGLGYNAGSKAPSLSPQVGSSSDNVMRAYGYGPVKPPKSLEDGTLDDRARSAKDSFERKLDKAVRNIGAISEIELLYDLLKLKFDSLEGVPQVKASWKTIFWNTFFSNSHIDLTWMPFARSKMPQDLNVYESWHERGTSYAEMLRILLDREYVIDDYDALNNVLIPELEYFAITIAVSEDVLKIIEDILDKRLDEISPDSPKGLFAYIRAIWLLDVWLNERYNLLQEVDIETLPAISEKLSKLMEVYIRIPLGPLKQLLLIDNPKVMEGLWQHTVREILSGDITRQTKGLLTMLFLLTQLGGKDKFGGAEAKDLLYPIFDPVIQYYEQVLTTPPLQSLVVGVPVNPLDADESLTKRSESFQKIYAAMLALHVLIESGLPLDKEKIRPLIRTYENLEPELQRELYDPVIFGQDGKEIYKLLKIKPKQEDGKPDGRKETKPSGRKHATLTPRQILSILPVLATGLFLAGCNGSSAGAFSAIGIMLLLGAVISQRGSGKGDTAAENEGEKGSGETYNPVGAKGAEDFLDAVSRYGNERTIVAFDTDIGNLSRREHPAQSLLQTLGSNRFKGMTVIKAKGSSNLMDALRREIGDRKDLNIIVICKNTNSDKLADLRNTGNRVFISGVNDSKINSIAYIPILELIALSLILSSGAGFDEVKELYSRITHEELTQEAYRMAKEGLLLVLPEIKRIDLKEIYDVQNKELLRSA